jgi:hypothetical protein
MASDRRAAAVAARRALAACGALAICGLLAAGCGGGSSRSEETGGTAQASRPNPVGPTDKSGLGEAATGLHLSRGDCTALAAWLRSAELPGSPPISPHSTPAPPRSTCKLRAPGTTVLLTLDTAYGARQRYANRLVEQVQFNTTDPRAVPHYVPGVGDRVAPGRGANWIPAYSQLMAVRGNRWLTVDFSVPGLSSRDRVALAAELARRAFRLSAAKG